MRRPLPGPLRPDSRSVRGGRAEPVRFHHAWIAEAVHAAVLGELAVMDREDTALNPAPYDATAAHLASARSTSRSSCMISSASSIWRVKSGS